MNHMQYVNDPEWPLKPRGQKPLDWALLDCDRAILFTKEAEERIVRLRQENLSLDRIAKGEGVSRHAIKRFLDRRREEAY